MAKYTFDELIGRLPPCEQFPTNIDLPRGVSYGDIITEFVPPDVSFEIGDIQDSQVLIIAAPGAVGKSTLGRALSSKKSALMWDLAEAEEVGSGSLDAMLDYTIETGLKPEFIKWMKEGIQFIIIDALDEGRIKVNEQSFLRLLENISRLAKDAKDICFVLLGRTQIAESVWLSLTDQGINSSILNIDPFTREQANEYIHNRVNVQWTDPLFECRDLIFKRLEAPMKYGPESETTKAFLHYPPVLDVVSVLLNSERNLMALKNLLESQMPETSVKLLRDVINHLLKREQQEKFVPAFSERLTPEERKEFSQFEGALYTGNEQSQRLLASVLNVQIDCRPESLPLQMEAEYNAAVELQLAEHPFLKGSNRFANAVFESYLYAMALRGKFGTQLANRVTKVLMASSSLPPVLMADFYLDSAGSRTADEPQVEPEHVGLLYESLLSSESSRRRVRLSIEGSDPYEPDGFDAEQADGEFELLSTTREGETSAESEVISFTLNVTGDSAISFRRYVGDVHLTIPCAVELGSSAVEFKIGPSVHINASRINLGSEALVVEKVPPKYEMYADSGVVLEAREFEALSLNGTPTVYAREFYVSWPGDESDFHGGNSDVIKCRRNLTVIRSIRHTSSSDGLRPHFSLVERERWLDRNLK